MVSITLRVLSRPDTNHLPKIYQGLGLDYDERVLPSIGNEVLKSIVAQFDAAELITQREVVRQHFLCLPLRITNLLWQVSSRIREDLLARAGEFNIKLEDVSITHLTFGKVWFSLRSSVESLIRLALGIHASCRGEADRATRCVARRTWLIPCTHM